MKRDVIVWIDTMKSASFTYLLRTPILFSHIFPLLEPCKDLLDCGFLLFQLLHFQALSTPPGLFLQTFQRLLHELNVFDPEFFAYDVQVSNRVHVTLDVDYLGVVEASHDLKDGVYGPNVRQESVPQASTCGCPSRQAGDVVDGEIGRYSGFWVVMLAQPVISGVWNNHTSFFRVNRSVRKVL